MPYYGIKYYPNRKTTMELIKPKPASVRVDSLHYFYMICSEPYRVCQVGLSRFALISLTSGNRWREAKDHTDFIEEIEALVSIGEAEPIPLHKIAILLSI